MSMFQGGVLWVLFSFVVACGGASVDATENGVSETDFDFDADVEDDTDFQREKMQEPARLRSIGGTDGGNQDTRGTRADPDSSCSFDAKLPPDVPANSDAETLHSLGQERILAKDGPSAVAILFRAHKKEPGNASILGDLATALLQCRRYNDAITYIEKSAALEPGNVDIAANLAQVYQIAGRLDEAVAAYRRAAKVDPKDPAIRNNLAVLLILSDLEGAEKEARLAVNLAPEQATYLVNLGYILYRKKRLVDAEMVLRRALEVDSKSADAYNQLGLVLAAQKREPQAADAFRKALKLNPDHRAARENLGAMDEGFDFTGPWDKKE
ncbi:MAG: tetratricopeptide repeat protein [Deltaproteobacteria bacterium]|nr:tetratricopeptide repeat protein [Deltaproteobacteria bacterium]